MLNKTDKQQISESLPWFEKYLSEDAGCPGIIERFVAQSLSIMKMMQMVMGVNFIFIANAIDAIFRVINSYIDKVFQTWKTYRTLQRKIEREKHDVGQQVSILLGSLQKSRFFLARLHRFAGFNHKKLPFSQIKNWQEPSFPLKITIESRHYLDEMKRDLNFITTRQIKETTKGTIKDFLFSFIPNPIEWFTALKDVFIILFFMRYSRVDIERMYVEMLLIYQNMTQLLHPGKEAKIYWETYEKSMFNRLKIKNYKEDDLEKCIDECKKKIQRMIQMLCNPNHVLNPRKWSTKELQREVQKDSLILFTSQN